MVQKYSTVNEHVKRSKHVVACRWTTSSSLPGHLASSTIGIYCEGTQLCQSDFDAVETDVREHAQ